MICSFEKTLNKKLDQKNDDTLLMCEREREREREREKVS
jgi:hypothetical protein